jgi:hypothetical protein
MTFDEAPKRSARGGEESNVAMTGFRPAVIPVVVFLGAISKNSEALFSEIAPWAYLGFAAIFIGLANALRRRQRKGWPWGIALAAGFVIALASWLGAMAIVSVFAPAEVGRG